MLPPSAVATQDPPKPRIHKRKATDVEEGEKSDEPKKKKKSQKGEEKRPRRFRQRAPLSYDEIRTRGA